jgi:ribosome-binding factor A
MSRVVRVNELVLRELSSLLHTRFRDRAVSITLTEVDITQDLRSARIYYAVLGDLKARHEAAQLLSKIKGELRTLLGKNVILKYTPTLEFVFDESQARGSRTLSILNELEHDGGLTPLPEGAEPPEPETPGHESPEK